MAGEAVLDSNVLLRYLTDEPRHLADRAAQILEAADSRKVALIVAPLIVAEVVYVLESVYSWGRLDIANRLLRLIASDVLDFHERAAVTRTLEWYRAVPKLDFADAYVASFAIERGHGNVVSFDRHLAGLTDIHVIQVPSALP